MHIDVVAYRRPAGHVMRGLEWAQAPAITKLEVEYLGCGPFG